MALVLTPTALGAGHQVETLLPRQVADPAGPEDAVLAQLLGIHVRCRGQGPEGPGRREKATLSGAVKMCRCFEYDTNTKKPMITATFARRNPVSTDRFADRLSPDSQPPTACDANAQSS